MRDFSLDMYGRLILGLKQNNFEFFRFNEKPFNRSTDSHHAILRHDVDRLPSRALEMARLEVRMGVFSTYFFRTKNVSFDKNIIKNIASMGHEIGYHYECLSDTRGDVDKAWALFCNELQRFDDLYDIKSIAMHGRPLLPYDNRDLWLYHDYRYCGIELEAYKDIPWDRYVYFTDVGGSWNSKYNLRDSVAEANSFSFISTTDQLIEQLTDIRMNVVISTHPERWPLSLPGWLQSRAFDVAVNNIKKLIKPLRK